MSATFVYDASDLISGCGCLFVAFMLFSAPILNWLQEKQAKKRAGEPRK